MVEFDTSIIIKRPVEDVFNFTIANENDAHWQGGVISSEQVAVREGETFTQVVQFLGRRLVVPLKIIKINPNQSYRLQSMGGPIPMEVEFRYQAIPEGTRFDFALEAEPGGFFKIAESLVERVTRRQWETNLANLKDLLESQN